MVDAGLVHEALRELMYGQDFPEDREAVARQKAGPEAFVLAKAVYDFVIEYPVDWSITPLTASLITEVVQATKSKYPFLSKEELNAMGNRFAFLNK